MIDTGEEENTVVEYLLDRKIRTIDFLLISHFDSDHSGKAVEIIETLKVENIIISKQSEASEQFENTIKAAKENKVNIIQVQAGDTIKIDKDIYLEILWPDINNTITNNPLNNNSIVAKMRYRDFSILFTGDIEEIAEKEIIKQYGNKELNSTVLKVAHHGSNTSSIQEFIYAVKPKIALIGVGKDNKFGHPNEDVIDRFQNLNCKIYRTDKDGEISMFVDKKGRIKINTYLNKNV